jgi:hypothetical protein
MMRRPSFSCQILHPLTECRHGPKTFPRWKLASFTFVVMRGGFDVPGTVGYRVWCYTRGGARHLDLYLTPAPPPDQEREK